MMMPTFLFFLFVWLHYLKDIGVYHPGIILAPISASWSYNWNIILTSSSHHPNVKFVFCIILAPVGFGILLSSW